jgi:hypothetical protein
MYTSTRILFYLQAYGSKMAFSFAFLNDKKAQHGEKNAKMAL